MKKLLSSLLLLFLLLSLHANDEVYIESEHFKIIYDETSKNMAAAIMNVAEEEYDRLVSFFNKDPNLHIPIYINSKEKSYNAYLATYPSLHLVFYNTWIPQTLYNGDQTIRLIFRHELTHALMYYYKGILGSITTTLFGDSADLSKHLHYLQFITEGMAVYLESYDGRGRLNNPLFDKLRIQAAIENQNINYLDASGSMDIYPGGTISYILGGEFFKWVADKYGSELLSAFILDIAENVFSFSQNTYKKYFNSTLYDDWNTFLASTTLPNNIIEPNTFSKKGRFTDLISYNDFIYALSSSSSKVLEIKDSTITTLFNYSPLTSAVAIKDDNFLLSYTSSNLCYTALYDKTGKELKRFDGYYEGTFYNNTIALLKYNDTNTLLDIIGEKTITLGSSVSASNIFSYNDKLGFLYEDERGQAIAIYNKTLTLYRINDDIRIYSINERDGYLSFSYCFNKCDEIVKYGEIDLETQRLYLSDINISGGVNNPARLNNDVYFCSDFFNYSKLSKIAISELNLSYYSTLKGEEFNSHTRIDVINGDKYNAFSSLLRGVFIPFASNQVTLGQPLYGIGLTWITQDPSERLSLIASSGYDLNKNNVFLSLSLSYDELKTLLSISPNQSETELSYSKTYYLKNQNQKIILSNSLFFNTPQIKFTNLFELSFSDLAKKGIERYNISGSKIAFKLINYSPIILAETFVPGMFPSSYGFSFDILNEKINIDLKSHLFNFEIQNSLYPIPLFITNIDCLANANFVFSKNGIDKTYKVSLLLSLSPTIGTLSKTYCKLGFEIKYKTQLSCSILFNYLI